MTSRVSYWMLQSVSLAYTIHNVCVIAVVQDLNRVINKPYTENKDDTSGQADEVSSSIICVSVYSP